MMRMGLEAGGNIVLEGALDLVDVAPRRHASPVPPVRSGVAVEAVGANLHVQDLDGDPVVGLAPLDDKRPG